MVSTTAQYSSNVAKISEQLKIEGTTKKNKELSFFQKISSFFKALVIGEPQKLEDSEANAVAKEIGQHLALFLLNSDKHEEINLTKLEPDILVMRTNRDGDIIVSIKSPNDSRLFSDDQEVLCTIVNLEIKRQNI